MARAHALLPALIAMIAMSALAACDPRVDPCAGLGGSCLGLQVEGAGIVQVDELVASVIVDGAATVERTARPSNGGGAAPLPVAVALRLPGIGDGALATIDLALVGRLAGAEVGEGSVRVELHGGAHASATVTLRPRAHDGGSDGDPCLLVCPSTIGCGQVSDRCGGTLDCGPCRVTAVSPSVARPSSVVTLEGAFADSATVEFPGGGTVSATILGPNRATAVVPASVTEGALVVRTGGETLPSLRFRGVQFRPALGAPQYVESQESGVARRAPRLTQNASYAAVGRYVYAFGGLGATGLDTVARARINADGSMGPLEALPDVKLAAGRALPTVVVLPKAVYLLGGMASATSGIETVERLDRLANDELSSGAIVPSLALPEPRARMATAFVGDSLYVIGGFSGGTSGGPPLATVLRSRISATGELSPFSAAPSLIAARRSSTAHAIGGWLYVIGGYFAATGDPTTTLERARISPDGTIGPFETVTGVTLNQGHVAHGSVILDDRLYVVGTPISKSDRATEYATIQPDGSLSTFTEDPAATLSGDAPFVPTIVVAGTRAWLFGAREWSFAPITVGASLVGQNAVSGLQFPVGPKVASAALVVGDLLHLVGGTVESAQIAPELPPVPRSTVEARADGSAFALLGNRLFALGGTQALDGGTGELRTVESGTFAADGSFSGFSVDSSLSLAVGRTDAAVVFMPSYSSLALLGGRSGGVPVATGEVSTISNSETLGAFAEAPGFRLAVARSGHRAIVIGNRVYVIGGMGASGLLGSVEMYVSGSSSAFAVVPGVTLSMPRQKHSLARVGNQLYVLGGEVTGPFVTVEVATINSDGTLTSFTTLPANTAGPGASRGSYSLGDTLYFAGGTQNGQPTRSIHRAIIR